VSPSRPVRTEWPTVLLAVAIHTGWLAVTWAHAALPPAVLMLCGGWLVAWHGSLQHETIHGHPTRWRWINMMIGSAPLALWLPYGAYRRSHIAHHRTGQVTDPFDDPESRYLSERRGPLSRPRRLVARIQAPLIGRLLLGPAIIIPAFLMREAKRLGADPASTLADWVPHGLGVAAILAWLHFAGSG
jgi:fatty acid desaturase